MSGGDIAGVWQIAVTLIIAGAVYGGIRADLKAIHEKLRGHKKSMRRLRRQLGKIRKNGWENVGM